MIRWRCDYLPSPLDIPAIKGTSLDGEEDARELQMKFQCQH